MKHNRKKLGLIWKVLIAIALGIGLGLFMPGWMVRIFVTFNFVFGQFISFFVPLIILMLVTAAIADTKNGAGKMLVWTLVLVYGSTFLAGLVAYGVGDLCFPRMITPGGIDTVGGGRHFDPYFEIGIPPVMDVISALVLAFILGLGILKLKGNQMHDLALELRDIVTMALMKSIVPLLPVYIFGIFLNMTAEGSVAMILGVFVKVILIVFGLSLVWLLGLYSVAGLVGGKNPIRSLIKMLPAYVTALATASSAATIPVTLRQAKELGVDEKVAEFTVPLCANVHLSGSAIKIVSFSVAVMVMQGMSYDMGTMVAFIGLLGITMVAAPGVPGGAIMAAVSLLSSVLGFGEEEIALMISIYIAVDSFGTACNVTGDGAITIIIDRIVKRGAKEITE